MYDIHHHLIFGIDDGPKSIEASLRLAELSLAEGITHIVCTPHANSRYAFQPEVNKERVAILNERLDGRITLGLGCEMYLSFENIVDAFKTPPKYTINGGKYLLVEVPEFTIPWQISKFIYQFNESGMVPILAHPERNPALVANPSQMAEWMRNGGLVQVTAASLSGRFGKRAAVMSNDLIKKNWVHFIASDAHHPEGRPPAMRKAFEFLKSRYGQETAERLCIDNPRAVFLNEPLPPQPEPQEHVESSSLLRHWLQAFQLSRLDKSMIQRGKRK